MPMPKRAVPFAPPSITQLERDAVAKALAQSRLSMGPYVEEFEQQLADYSRLPHAVACSSGTAALHLAMLSLGVGPDDVVIVPELTYVASANAALYVGAQVAFADVQSEGWQSSDRDLRAVIQNLSLSEKGRIVVVIVDLYSCCNSDTALWALSQGYTVIYDAAHSMLAPTGHAQSVIRAHAERFAMIYSFFPSKHITTGEGGAVLFAHQDLDARARLYRGQGAPYPKRYFHSVLGYNYRMTDIAASLGLAQLSRVAQLQSSRLAVVEGYTSVLGAQDAEGATRNKRTPWVVAIDIGGRSDRDAVINTLRAEFSIDARPVFEPMSSLPHLRHRIHPLGQSEAREISARGILLPTYADMSADDVAYVVESLNEVLNRS